MEFYIDQDDTCAAFRDHAVACGVPKWEGTWYTADPATWSDEQHFIQQRTNELMLSEEFWLTMPVLDGAFEIIAAAATRRKSSILTAYPRTCPDRAMVHRAKIKWAAEKLHFPRERVIVCERQEKVAYAARHTWDGIKPNVLIDDAEKNCAEWEAAGGIAIHHTPGDAAETIRQIRQLL